MALTTLGVPPGPIHGRAPVRLDRLRLGDAVVVTGALLQAGPLVVDLKGAQVWHGRLPTVTALDAGQRLAVDLLAVAPAPSVEAGVGGISGVADLAAVASRLGGFGPGLTPAGDDCLAGILLVARIRWGVPAEEDLVAVARAVDTGDVAAAFLLWAARGQTVEPVHRFLLAAAAGRAGDADAALADLLGFGHSSGADLAYGLRLGLSRVASCAGTAVVSTA
jgi:hypothetical protein